MKVDILLTVGKEGLKDLLNSGGDLDIDQVMVHLLLVEDVGDGVCREELRVL